MNLLLYDTTLRDGTQREGLSLSVDDKVKIARRLDELGVHCLEGGWPGSNPKDAAFFRRIRTERLRQAKVAAFGMTRHAGTRCRDDGSLQALLEAETPVVTIVGKSSTLHVDRVLETSRDENLRMISDSVAWFKQAGKEVIYDAEHFFDGHRLDAAYALATLRAAADAGADCIVLCDTNGGELPDVVERCVREVREDLATPLGIHPHNDSGLALANALAAVRAGCVHVQGTINGYGERCGNLDLIPLVATLQLKLGYTVLPPDQLRRLTEVAQFVAAVANLNPDSHAPYVGRSAFAHKGGIHVAAVAKLPESYQHIDPALVGNEMRVIVSELAGRRNVRLRAEALGAEVAAGVPEGEVLQRIKDLEHAGLQFEAADGSFEMLVRRAAPDYRPAFELLGFTVVVEERNGGGIQAQAMVQLRVGAEVMHTAAEGAGPVNALDRAVRKALLPHYPELADVHLVDYKVRIVDEHLGTAAKPRVVVESACGAERWSTMGCSENIIEASWQALRDSLELPLVRRRASPG
ncbi:MAG TPA: citramalate synthase [Gemmatimonadales bacterium]|nr:citramalate synthase [Gemmatimonadales bacterium]